MNHFTTCKEGSCKERPQAMSEYCHVHVYKDNVIRHVTKKRYNGNIIGIAQYGNTTVALVNKHI